MKIKILKGATFLEVLLVIALIFFFAALLLPIGIDIYRRGTVRNLAQELENRLREAQIAALSNRGGIEAGIKIKPGEYILFEGSSFEERRAALDMIQSYPAEIKIRGISEIIFQREKGLPIFPGLVGHWQLNNTSGNIFDDYSLYGDLNDGEIFGSFSWLAGKEKMALELQNGKIEVAHHPSLNPERGLTLSLWLNINQLESRDLVKKGNPPFGYRLSIDAQNSAILFEIGDGTNSQILTNQFEPAKIIGQWGQIVAVWDGQTMSQYLNGEKLPQTKEFNQPIAGSTEKLVLAENFSGKIDDVRLYNFGLSEEDIKANYLSKRDDIIIDLDFQGQKSEIIINHQGLIFSSPK